MNKSTKNLIATVILGAVVYVFGNYISGGFDYKSTNEFLADFIFYQLYAFVLAYSNLTFFDYWSRNNWKRDVPFLRILVGLFISVIITSVGLFLLRMFTAMVYNNLSFYEFFEVDNFKSYQFGLGVTLTIVIVYHLISFYNEHQKNKLKEQKVIATTASAQFESLKNQIDPHFLFNSLNVLGSLIEENPINAQRFTVSLSKIYRYVLEQKDKELVTVAEELEFARTYMNLLKMRFENSINFEMPNDFDNPDARVVPLSLQLLLENTIKHNTVSETRPLQIRIIIDDNYLVVENNLQKKEVLHGRKGVGLQNIVDRYGILTQRPVLVEEASTFFKVKIPVLTKQTAILFSKSDYMNDQAYARAVKRVEEIKGFFGNVISYCVVIPFLILINYNLSWGNKWFWFPMLGWGIGIVFHAVKVFYGYGWEERRINELMKQEEKETKTWN